MPSFGSKYLTIQGIQETQHANLRLIANMQPSGALGRMVQNVTIAAHAYAVSITHVDTGALKGSHRMDVRGTRGEIYIDPGAVNPRSLQNTADYGPIEHGRGGSHAFYERTYQRSDSFINQAAQTFERDISR